MEGEFPRPLDRPPGPPPEAAPQPNMGQLAGGEATAGMQEQRAMAMQAAMGIEQMLFKLAQLLPGFQPALAQIIPLLREGVAGATQTAQPQPMQGGLF